MKYKGILLILPTKHYMNYQMTVMKMLIDIFKHAQYANKNNKFQNNMYHIDLWLPKRIVYISSIYYILCTQIQDALIKYNNLLGQGPFFHNININYYRNIGITF